MPSAFFEVVFINVASYRQKRFSIAPTSSAAFGIFGNYGVWTHSLAAYRKYWAIDVVLDFIHIICDVKAIVWVRC